MSALNKNVIATAALLIASTLFVATSRFEPVERSAEASADIALDDEGTEELRVLVRLVDLPEIELRPDLFSARLRLHNDEARRSTDVVQLDVEGAEPVRVRDGLEVPLNFDLLCPEVGDCVVEMDFAVEGRKGVSEEIIAEVVLASEGFDRPLDETDGEAVPLHFDDLVFEVEIAAL